MILSGKAPLGSVVYAMRSRSLGVEDVASAGFFVTRRTSFLIALDAFHTQATAVCDAVGFGPFGEQHLQQGLQELAHTRKPRVSGAGREESRAGRSRRCVVGGRGCVRHRVRAWCVYGLASWRNMMLTETLHPCCFQRGYGPGWRWQGRHLMSIPQVGFMVWGYAIAASLTIMLLL